MTTSKQAKLSITLKSVELIKELSLGLAPVGCFAVRNLCNEISRTLINQAGEIDALTAKVQSLSTAANSYEVHWDSLIFAIMGADGTADIIDAADAERITAAAIAAVKKLASERDENRRMAEAFQTVAGCRLTRIPVHHELKIAPEFFKAIICGQKKSEIRINNRDFDVNDRLILKEWDNDKYTGWQHEVVITHITNLDFLLPSNSEREQSKPWVSLSLSEICGLEPECIQRYLNSCRMSKAKGAQ
ncbi:DUF3850 domain-containing protein [Rahnella sp. ChDrAdgB13]|uniref:DUF3850 domain-containing protein n=1 Tax=Rahnella sp. ChDrAdgB13 TaxID=1850581 RepID=UPI001AD87DA1|nr:DUF3850 domain-containing protein [Rahnella sp. ChDrAdgB13]